MDASLGQRRLSGDDDDIDDNDGNDEDDRLITCASAADGCTSHGPNSGRDVDDDYVNTFMDLAQSFQAQAN